MNDRYNWKNYLPPYTPMVEVVPPGERGDFKVTHFSIDDEEAKHQQMLGLFSGSMFGYSHVRDMCAGEYVRLSGKGNLWMTDTPMERRTNLDLVRVAHGNVLVAGLGLGMVTVPLLKDPDVKRLFVVELERDVVDLVVPAIEKHVLAEQFAKLEVICGNIFDVATKPFRGMLNVIWFDIWPSVCTDNLPEMGKLHRRFQYCVDRNDPQRFVGSWYREDLLAMRREERRGGW